MSLVQSVGLVNSQNAHFSNPGFSSKVGAVTGCGGSGSELALQQKGLYQVVQGGGKRMKKRRSKKHGSKKHGSKKHKKSSKNRRSVRRKSRVHRGGYGHGFAENQPDDMNGNATHVSYSSTHQSHPAAMESHKLSGGMRKRKSHNKRKSHTKGKKTSNKRRTGGKKRRSHRQRGGYSQYMSNVANAHNYSLGGELTSKDSALASPPPFTPNNDCLNSWKHLGDTEPYNKIIA
tara:strand:+ start:133 stop:828 length:696 start_codon:yes stop_codon:yes gene_type:complete